MTPKAPIDELIEAVFISDLHLHPEEKEIVERFNVFVNWAKHSVKRIYILGDFFHAWPGDDAQDEWSDDIASKLHDLSAAGVEVFYMSGNRDFLLGHDFAKRAGWAVLKEPTVILLGNKPVLLVHGDRYCTTDKKHQRFRRLTRNKLFAWLFLQLPLNYRKRLVNAVRQISQSNQSAMMLPVDVVSESVIKHMKHNKVNTVIHGHTHKPGLTSYQVDGGVFRRYVLSDWDDKPVFLCYYKTNGFLFF